LFSSVDEFKDLDLKNYPEILKAFDRRIEGWFFHPLEKLLADQTDNIMSCASECMLVDSLAGFYYGLQRNNRPEHFISFMKDGFDIPNFLAVPFYIRFRCGILHQTFIKERSCVTLDLEDSALFLDENNVLFFNPRLFYSDLDTYFKGYVKKLQTNADCERNFRVHFKFMFENEFAARDWANWI
jgi:hypothetical protein